MRVIILFFVSLIVFSCGNKIPESHEVKMAELSSPATFFGFTKADSVNPVLTADNAVFTCPILNRPVSWAEKDVFNPAAVVRNDTLFLLYRAEDKIGKYAGTSRIGLAWSTDGLHFTKHPTPVLYPDNDSLKKYEWEGGCEDPRVVRDSAGTYYMTYTAYDGQKARLLIATSTDLYHWTKHGTVFKNADSLHLNDTWSKSGSIVSDYEFGTPVAERINGKYWMYGGDVNIWVASSDDLLHWSPVMKVDAADTTETEKFFAETNKFKTVFGPRHKKFDSDLVESGPPALVTPHGIWLLYNSRNVRATGDTSLPDGTYAAGYAIMDSNNPAKIIGRSDTLFIKPDKPYEITGQVNNVCFIEGLVKYHGHWFLYYGTADSRIAVAVK